ncbi:MAG TPA: hypothetical protein VFR73_16015, partial [Hyphomicrobiaceae bacterium]|nr:hypothetical protein [Hyphomicrobiaceae bacterium]
VLEAQVLRLHLLMRLVLAGSPAVRRGPVSHPGDATEISVASVQGRTPGEGERLLSAGARTMWKAAREEFTEIVWLVCIIGGLSVLAVASAAALAAG